MPDEGHPVSPQSIKRRIRLSIAQKLNVIAVAESRTVQEAASTLEDSEGYIRLGMANQAKLKRCRGVKVTKHNTVKSRAKPVIPDPHGLVTYIMDLHRQAMTVTSSHMLEYLRQFAERRGFSRHLLYRQKKSQEELKSTRIAFGKQFHDEHPGIYVDVSYNTDESRMYYAT
ncbi:hypothetical protein H257_17275 [Aphanomyces astaci]|uniref:Uncharacterized protein n=1 Tax=Aphanomyces astaci TaxID=112090 RepID=W4FHL4_APHAT|nr:hypothetical protein H257_17275 [Aphanomyces astaci]ETV66233.1 hypothetical protein H257_17275 [Aphanomyces astaci]|eukprot:XP_009844302.1 hypothetical protein H257_17275 [Aphanomyces astaci]